MNIDAEIQRINTTAFFSNMGNAFPDADTLIRIDSLRAAFVEHDFTKRHRGVEWLPTSPTEPDLFHDLPKPPADLAAQRMKVNKAVMAATRNLDFAWFKVDQHDFIVAARGGIWFAFRQYVSEAYYGLGDQWRRVVDIYHAGHWPIGVVGQKIVLV